MDIKKDDIINAISKMNVMEIVELVKEMEKKFDVSASNIITSNNNTIEKEKETVKEKQNFL